MTQPRGPDGKLLPHDTRTFEVTVWDWEGGIVKKLWEATADEVDQVRERYEDEPMYSVVIEER